MSDRASATEKIERLTAVAAGVIGQELRAIGIGRSELFALGGGKA